MMHTIYRMRADELDQRFLRALQTMFEQREIEIVVYPVEEAEEENETAYLLRSPANRERLLKALANVATDENLVTVDLEGLQSKPLFLSKAPSKTLLIGQPRTPKYTSVS